MSSNQEKTCIRNVANMFAQNQVVGQRVTSLIHMFPVDPLKSLFGNSLLHLHPQISSQLQFVIVEVTGKWWCIIASCCQK